MLLGVLAASRAGNSSGDATQAVIVGSQAAMMQGQLNFSRDMEREADRIGWGVLQGAGFAPQGMAAMFETPGERRRLTDNGAYPYLRSHPLTVERIGEARARVEATPATAARSRAAAGLGSPLMQARARVLMDPAVQALRRWQALDASTAAGADERLGALYAQRAGLGRAARTGARAGGARRGAALVPKDGDARAAFALGACCRRRCGSARGRPPRALAWFDAQRGAASGMRARARDAAARRRPRSTWPAAAAVPPAALRQSTEALQTWVAEHKGDAAAWTALAQAADAARPEAACAARRGRGRGRASATCPARSTACAPRSAQARGGGDAGLHRVVDHRRAPARPDGAAPRPDGRGARRTLGPLAPASAALRRRPAC